MTATLQALLQEAQTATATGIPEPYSVEVQDGVVEIQYIQDVTFESDKHKLSRLTEVLERELCIAAWTVSRYSITSAETMLPNTKVTILCELRESMVVGGTVLRTALSRES